MTWTYGADPSRNAKDEVRFLVGDTDQDSPLISDEEIAFILTVEAGASPRYSAAAAAAESIAASCAKKMDKTVGGTSLSWSQRYDHYLALSDRLRKQDKSLKYGNVGGPLVFGDGPTYLGPTPDPASYTPDT